MKTQLLEDIGESTAVPPPTSKPAAYSNAGKGAPEPAPVRRAPPPRARGATGVWRPRLAWGPPAAATRPPEEATPLELDKVFGEIAALEAQFVRPQPQQALGASQAESTHQPDMGLAQATAAPEPTRAVPAPQEPFFDFTPPAPSPSLADRYAPAPIGRAQSRKRPLIWAACAFSAALLIWGGWYLVEQRNDAGSLALIAGQVAGAAGGDSVWHEPALAPSTVQARTHLPDVPPLVMLEPDPPSVVKPEPVPKVIAAKRASVTAPKTVRAARQAAASPSPKPSIRKPRERSAAPAAPAKEKRRRDPARQLARASTVGTERASTPEDAMAETLKACREHGYHAAQCIKRQCSVGTYGFACRGR